MKKYMKKFNAFFVILTPVMDVSSRKHFTADQSQTNLVNILKTLLELFNQKIKCRQN